MQARDYPLICLFFIGVLTVLVNNFLSFLLNQLSDIYKMMQAYQQPPAKKLQNFSSPEARCQAYRDDLLDAYIAAVGKNRQV